MTAPIPVTLVFGSDPPPAHAHAAGTAVLRLSASRSAHTHAGTAPCPACAAQTDIRALLFELLESARQGLRPPFDQVVVDIGAGADPEPVIAALSGRLPARAWRDHSVFRAFYLVPGQYSSPFGI